MRKITYYSISESYHLTLPVKLQDRNFATPELAIKAIKDNYTPFNYYQNGISLDLDNLTIYGEKEIEVTIGERKVRGKAEKVPIKEKQKTPCIVADYAAFNKSKEEFYRKNEYGFAHLVSEGFFITKVGDVKEIISEDEIHWEAPVFVQFWRAERKFTPEVKEAGKPYSPKSYEVLNEEIVSEWLPIYYTPSGSYNSRNRFYLDPRNCGRYDVCKQYVLTDSFNIRKNELEIEE